MWFKNTIKYWPNLYKEIRVWWIFRKTSTENVQFLNKEHNLRVDWLGRIYGIVNLPEEVQGASSEIQQAYVLQNITNYGKTMLKLGLGDVVYPEIQKVNGTASYLVILWPVFDYLSLLKVISGVLKTSMLFFILYLLYRLAFKNSESLLKAWDYVTTFF
jgi:hypothetical protein